MKECGSVVNVRKKTFYWRRALVGTDWTVRGAFVHNG